MSLFDGISTGHYTLSRKLQLDIDVYYSAETCRDAMRVQRQNFQEHIIPVGSVSDLTIDRIKEMGRIDLLIGGSPCEELSLVNPKAKGVLGKMHE